MKITRNKETIEWARTCTPCTYSHGTFQPRGTGHIGQSVLIHDPIRFNAVRRATRVKHQIFLHPYSSRTRRSKYRLISSSSLPKTHTCRPIRPHSIWILAIPWTKEVPFIFSKQGLFCAPTHAEKEKNNIRGKEK